MSHKINLNKYPAKTKALPKLLAALLRNNSHLHFIRKDTIYTLKGSWGQTLKISLSHDLLKSGDNEWNMVKDVEVGSGASASVKKSEYKVVLSPSEARILATNDVVKIQQCNLDEAKSEADFQRQHQVRVKAVIRHGALTYTIVENCGEALDRMLQHSEDWSFEFRMQLALHICNEMLMLEQEGIIHHDLKPANICVIRKERQIQKVSLIDFGFSKKCDEVKEEKHIMGTPAYMAPEMARARSCPASDVYALAGILGKVFGALDVNKAKNKAGEDVDRAVNIPYNFDAIFSQVALPLEINSIRLIDDFKKLLNQMQAKDPRHRPSVEFINKFFIAIQWRIAAHHQFIEEFKNFAQLYLTQGISGPPMASNCPSISDEEGGAANALDQALDELMPVRGHYEIIADLYKNGKHLNAYRPFPSLTCLSEALLIEENQAIYSNQAFRAELKNLLIRLNQQDPMQKPNAEELLKFLKRIHTKRDPHPRQGPEREEKQILPRPSLKYNHFPLIQSQAGSIPLRPNQSLAALYNKTERGFQGLIKGLVACVLFVFSLLTTFSLKAYRSWRDASSPIVKMKISANRFNTLEAYQQSLPSPKLNKDEEEQIVPEIMDAPGNKKVIFMDRPQALRFNFYQARQKRGENRPLNNQESSTLFKSKLESLEVIEKLRNSPLN